MAVNVGGIYFSAELDDSPLKKSIKDIENSIRLMSGTVATNVNKSAQAFDGLSASTAKLNKNITYSQDTIQGLTARVEKLQGALSKSKIDSDGFKRLNDALAVTKKKLEETTGVIPKLNPPLQKTADIFKSITQAVSAMGLGTLASSVVNTTAKFEKYQAVLTNTYQSSDKAAKSFAFIKEFAASTPFSVDELTSSFIKFLNRGLEPTKESLTAFGDIAASQGKSFDQFTEAVLDATSGEFERLKEFGIQASKSGDQVALSFKGQTLSIRNTKEEIEKALISFGKMPGVADSMASVSKTTEGAFSNLGDAMDSLKVALGNVFLPLVKDIVIGLSSIVTSVKNFIEGLSPLGIGILKAGGILTGFIVSINGIIGVLGLLGPAAASAGAAMSLALGPVGLIVAGLTAGMYALVTAMQDAKNQADQSTVVMGQLGAVFTKDGINKAKQFSFELGELAKRRKEISDITVATQELSPRLDSLAKSALEAGSDIRNFVNKVNGVLIVDTQAIEKYIAGIKEADRVIKEKKSSPALPSPSKSDKPESAKFISDIDRANKALSEALKKSAKEAQNSEQYYGDLFQTIKSIGESWKAAKEAFAKGDWATAIVAGVDTAKKSLAALGNAFIDIMSANTKLAQVKFTNLSQNVDFAVNAVLNSYDRQQEALLANIDSEIQAIEDQKKALLATEEQYLIDLAMLREQFSDEEKNRNDAAYNAEVEKLEADYQKKLEYLKLNTADEVQFAVQKALLQEDLDAAKINLRNVFDKKLLDSIAANDKKLDEQQNTRQVSQVAQIEALDERKNQLEQKRLTQEKNAEQERQNLIKATELFKWSAGRGAFEMQKRMQVAQVQMQMASIIMSGIQAAAGIAAATLGFGAPIGFALAATLTGMGLAASATSMAAINSTQYPPPPVFAEGGIVGGNSFTGDQVDAKVNSGEMILNARQQAELFSVANGKNGMGTTNNIYLGGVKVESVQGGVEAIASRVSAIIRKDIYQAYGGLSA